MKKLILFIFVASVTAVTATSAFAYRVNYTEDWSTLNNRGIHITCDNGSSEIVVETPRAYLAFYSKSKDFRTLGEAAMYACRERSEDMRPDTQSQRVRTKTKDQAMASVQPSGPAILKEIEANMVSVKGGCYQMGDTFGDGEADEKPVHEVCISDFKISKYEVTQEQWLAVMGDNPSHYSNCGLKCPVEEVSWDDIQGYIRKLNATSGKKYRLPTEAEWEYAARSSGKQEKYAGTNSESSLGSYAWYLKNSEGKTHLVGQKKPNGLGLYDMSGNVCEFCSDWYGENYYSQSPRDNPQGPSSGTSRVVRGGFLGLGASYARASDRSGGDNGNRFLGFRLVAPRGQ